MFKRIQGYLETLGLDKGASKSDIKAAYHRLALQHHPDKSGTPATTDKFTKITEAYEFLMAWDGPHDNTLYQQTEEWTLIFESLLSDLAQRMLKLNRNSTRKKKGKVSNVGSCHDVYVDIQVTLDDLYNAKIKKLLVKVHAKNNQIHHEELYISLLNYKDQYRFNGKGDYIDDDLRGDIVVNLKVKDHDLVKIDKIVFPFDLFIDFPISLHDYYFRKYLALPYLNNEIVELDMSPGKKCVRIPDKGLPYYNEHDDEHKRGDLYVHLNLILPEYVPLEAKQTLLTYFC